MKVCQHEVKLFCKDYVERAEIMFIVATLACALVVMSLVSLKMFVSSRNNCLLIFFITIVLFFQVHYLMCLAANYAHIKGHEKLQDYHEMQYLQGDTHGESEMTAFANKDRDRY